MFVCMTSYLQSLEKAEAEVQAHWDYLDGKLAVGELLCSGPKVPRTGGLLVLWLNKREDAVRFMEDDPLVAAGLVTYQLVEFEATRFAFDVAPA